MRPTAFDLGRLHEMTATQGTGVRELVRQRTWRRWTLSSFLARMPVAMSVLGLVLAGQAATGSLATGAKLAGTATFCAGLAGPVRGRLLDRAELRGRLQRSCFLNGGMLMAFAACTIMKANIVILYAVCVGIGYSVSGVWGGYRALLIVAVDSGSLRRAHFVESLMVEFSWGVGPLLVTLLAELGGAVAVLLGMAAIAFLAGFSLIGSARLHPRPTARTHLLRQRKDIRVFVAMAFGLGFGVGTLEANVAQRMAQYGLPANVAGVFLLLLSVGSVTGGTYVSLRPIRRQRMGQKASILFAVYALLVLPSALATSALAYAECLLFASLMLVPISGLGSSEIEARLGEAQRAEAFSSVMAATMIGGGLGNVLNGLLVARLGAWNIPYFTIGTLSLLAVVLAFLTHHAKDSQPPGETGMTTPAGSSE
jgi:hypothetical protein